MTGIDERNLEHIFYNGLKPEMQEVIKMKEPKGLTEHITVVVGMEGSAFCRSVSTAVQDSHYRKGVQRVVLIRLGRVQGTRRKEDLKKVPLLVLLFDLDRSIQTLSWIR